MSSDGSNTPSLVVDTIHLTHDEEKLFSFLLAVAKQKHPGLTLRVAGGWVRDKVEG
jgi:hypothetical protein